MPLTPEQTLRRRRAEAVIAVVAPVLELVLRAGDRVSRIAGSDEPERQPIRPAPGLRELRGMRTIGRGEEEAEEARPDGPEDGDEEVVEGEPA